VTTEPLIGFCGLVNKVVVVAVVANALGAAADKTSAALHSAIIQRFLPARTAVLRYCMVTVAARVIFFKLRGAIGFSSLGSV
jgi:hypothetical protein